MVCNHHSFIHLFRSQSPGGIPNIQRFNHPIFKSHSPTDTTLSILISYLTSLNHSSSTKRLKKPGLRKNGDPILLFQQKLQATSPSFHLFNPALVRVALDGSACCVEMTTVWIFCGSTEPSSFPTYLGQNGKNGRIISWSQTKICFFW